MRLIGVVGLRGVVVACLCSGGIACAAGPALGDGTSPHYPGSVLHVRAGGPLTPGSTLTITATGTNALIEPFGPPPEGPYGLSLFLQNTDMLSVPCSNSESAENTISINNIKAVKLLTFDSLSEGDSGPFNISLPVMLNAGTGHLQVCAYSTFVTDDAAWASTQVTIVSAGGSPGALGRPAAVTRPRVTRSGGHLVCSRGSWSHSPTAYRYRWLVLHRVGTAGRGRTLGLSNRLRGRTVECLVTATNSTGSATATSRPFKI